MDIGKTPKQIIVILGERVLISCIAGGEGYCRGTVVVLVMAFFCEMCFLRSIQLDSSETVDVLALARHIRHAFF